MDTLIPKNMEEVLKPELKRFKSFLLDDNYDEFKDYDKEAIYSLYIYSLLDNPTAIKKVKEICITGGIEPKQFNKFIYISMKYVDKVKRGCYSWYEIDTWNVPVEEIKETTLSYTII